LALEEVEMKWAIRIGGGLLAALLLAAVVLAAMGQRSNAGRLQASVDVNASREQVWPWITEPEKLKQWVSWMVEVRGGATTGVGSKSVWVMRDENNGGQIMEIHSICSEYTPPSQLRVTVGVEQAFGGDQIYRLQDLGSGRTRLEAVGRYRFDMWFAKLLEPLITPAAEKKLVGDMTRLKSLVEDGASR
jgi:uncharacterized protein YndB with AHSA1/START domain